jgi:hypothetical protein
MSENSHKKLALFGICTTTPALDDLVGRPPWPATDPLVGLLARSKEPDQVATMLLRKAVSQAASPISSALF